MVPEKKITVEDVKYVLSSHYQGTPYDPYAAYGDKSMRGAYRSIGINRNDVMTLIQMRPEGEPVQWLALASNAFNVLAPFYTGIDRTPEYLSATTGKVSTENFYWMSRMIAAMADASYNKSVFHIERYQENVAAKSHVSESLRCNCWRRRTMRTNVRNCRKKPTKRRPKCCGRQQPTRWTRYCTNLADR